jgi:hypothetical protein
MGTTVDTAEAGQETPGIQSARAARQLREARIRFWRVFVVSSFFILCRRAGREFDCRRGCDDKKYSDSN